MAFHTPHGSARFRLPWSWSSFDYRELCERCGSRADARFEIAKVDGRERHDRAHGPRRPHGAADRRRPRLAADPRHPRAAAGGADLARPRGPPARRLDRPRRVDRPLARPLRLRLVGARGRRAAHRRRLLRAARSRQGADAGHRRPAGARRRSATRATGSRTGCARPPRTACSSSATAPATACLCRARASAPRFTSGSRPGGRSARPWRRSGCVGALRRVLAPPRAGVRVCVGAAASRSAPAAACAYGAAERDGT